MLLKYTYLTTILLPFTTSQTTSPKRGLCHVPSTKHPSDDKIWLSGASPPTWYYNYGATPSPAYTSSPRMQFVPMLWGASPSDTGTPFLDAIKKQLSSGANITHILSFNEPDADHSVGGSNLNVQLAAARWTAELAPLQKMGLKVSAPAVTGAASGWTWLENFYAACGEAKCTPDFVAVHWYGDFQGMMSHMGRVAASNPGKEIWVTEYAYPHQRLEAAQEFYNLSAQAMDRWENVTRYSYFGAFRSDVANVGASAAMLTERGELTDIGAWYLGERAEGRVGKAESSGVGARGRIGWWEVGLGVVVCLILGW